MMRRLFGRKAQSTLEYAVLIAIIGAGLALLSGYVRKGYQGKMRTAGDQLGDQFEPGKTTYEYIVDSDPVTVDSKVTEDGDVIVTRTGGGTGVRADETTTPWE